MPRILAYASALALVAALAACNEEPLALSALDALVPMSVTDAEREELQGALLFAGEQSVLALQSREASAPLASALISLLQGVERNDRTAVEQGVSAARAAMQRYRELAGEGSGDPDLEVLALTLDITARLAGRTEKTPIEPIRSAESLSRQER